MLSDPGTINLRQQPLISFCDTTTNYRDGSKWKTRHISSFDVFKNWKEIATGEVETIAYAPVGL